MRVLNDRIYRKTRFTGRDYRPVNPVFLSNGLPVCLVVSDSFDPGDSSFHISTPWIVCSSRNQRLDLVLSAVEKPVIPHKKPRWLGGASGQGRGFYWD